MTYEYAQYLSQLVSMAIFMGLAVAVVIYAFRKSNKSKFEQAAKIALDGDETFRGR